MRRTSSVVLVGIGFILALTTGCAPSTEPGARTERRPALLSFYSDSAQVTLPDTAKRLQPITVTITSYGGGCISQGETDVAVSDLQAEIRPYRYEVVGPGVICTLELRVFEHVATLQFAKSGTATVRVLGERQPGTDAIEVDRLIAVVP